MIISEMTRNTQWWVTCYFQTC